MGPTRFAFVLALKDRWKDWQNERARKRQQKELEKRRAVRPQLRRNWSPRAPPARSENSEADVRPREAHRAKAKFAASIRMNRPERTGIERTMVEERQNTPASSVHPASTLRSPSAPTLKPKPKQRCRRLPVATSFRRRACCTVPTNNNPSTQKNSNSSHRC